MAVVDASLVVEVTPSLISPAAVGKGEPGGRRQGDTQCHNECRLSEPLPRGECRQWSFALVHLTSLDIHLECCDAMEAVCAGLLKDLQARYAPGSIVPASRPPEHGP